MLENVRSYGGDVALVTITAPGAGRLPWAECGSRVRPELAHRWNRHAPANWRSLHRAAATRARRRHGKLTVLAWSWEYQRRGVLHKHLILGMASARERAAAHTYLLALDELRHRHDFGFVSDTRRNGSWRRKGVEVIPAIRAGRYVAKYIAKRTDDGSALEVSETVTRPDVPPLVVYVAAALTLKTGVTMRFLRLVRLAHVLAPKLDIPEGEVLQLLLEGVKLWRVAPSASP